MVAPLNPRLESSKAGIVLPSRKHNAESVPYPATPPAAPPDLGFRVQGSGFRVQGSGFRVQGSGFRVEG